MVDRSRPVYKHERVLHRHPLASRFDLRILESLSFFRTLGGSSYHLSAMPPTEEDLAWIKSTFHPVPRPQLPDDCVEYSLHIISAKFDQINDSEVRLRLREVQQSASELQKKWLKSYIWQRQGFGLELVKEDGEVCRRN